MYKQGLKYSIFSALTLIWLFYALPILKQIYFSNTPVFPFPDFHFKTVFMLLTSVLLTGFILLAEIPNISKLIQSGELSRWKLFSMFTLLLIVVPVSYAIIYEQNNNGISQVILDLALMDEDFDDVEPGSDPPGWDEQDGNWTAVNDDGNIVYYQEDNSDKEALSISTTGNSSWTDYDYEVDVKFVEGNTKKDDRGALLLFRYQGGNSYYYLWMKEYLDTLELHNRGDGAHVVASTSCELVQDTWYHVKITIIGQTVDVSIDDTIYFSGVDMSGSFATGSVAIGTSYYKCMFDNIYVEPL